MPIPRYSKIFHIVHVDRLPSIVECGGLWSDSEVIRRTLPGTTVGMNHIKERRRKELTLSCYPHLHVGDCVPFYFCPRSVMLYLIYRANNTDLLYRGSQIPIIHLEANLDNVIKWADNNKRCWVFTTSNAGSYYFEDFCSYEQLNKIDWDAIHATDWSQCKDKKQAEFLIEKSFPFELVTRIGVYSNKIMQIVQTTLSFATYKPPVEIKRDWYY